MHRFTARAWVIFVVLLGGLAARSDAAPAAPPRLVLLYATCTLNVNYLSPYNDEVPYTPFLEQFSRESTLFTKHQCESGRSSIDYAALFSGYQAHRHLVFTNLDPLPEHVYTIAEAFQDAGYETFFWAAHPFASVQSGFAQGVEPKNIYDGNGVPAAAPYHARGFLRADDERFQAILRRLESDPSYRALVITNFSVTHGKYDDTQWPSFCKKYPDQCEGITEADFKKYWANYSKGFLALSLSFDTAVEKLGLDSQEVLEMTHVIDVVYRSNVHRLDRLFGDVLSTIRNHGLYDESLIAFTADHGEALYREGLRQFWNHGFSLAPEVLQVPFILHVPGMPAGRFDRVTRSIDVFPTLAGLARVAIPNERGRGVDLSFFLANPASAPELVAYSHTSLAKGNPGSSGSMIVSARKGDTVYQIGPASRDMPGRAVFDLRSDPLQLVNVYDAKSVGQAEIFADMLGYKSELISTFKGRTQSRKPSAADLERLRQLGYE